MFLDAFADVLFVVVEAVAGFEEGLEAEGAVLVQHPRGDDGVPVRRGREEALVVLRDGQQVERGVVSDLDAVGEQQFFEGLEDGGGAELGGRLVELGRQVGPAGSRWGARGG
jgi:hypothetical protein